MNPKKVVTQLISFSLLGLFLLELIFPVQVFGQKISLSQNQPVEEFVFEPLFFSKAQTRNPQIVEIRRVRPQDEAAFKKLPKISREELEKIVSSAQTRVLTDKSIRKALDQNLKIQAQNRTEFARVYAKRPDLLQFLLRGKNVPNPSVITGKQGRRYALINRDAMIRDMLLMRSYLENNENQARNYEFLYQRFQERMKDVPAAGAGKFKALRTPAEVARLSNAQINEFIAQIVGLWLDYFSKPKGDGTPPRSCKEEEGTGNNGDSGAPCAAVNPNGLRAKTSWALENFNTCVRDQGSRGSCTAFGMTAAVESAVAVKHGRFVNLSEQDLYKKQKFEWFPFPLDFYGDGYDPAWSVISQMLTGYRYPFEKDWDYNKSRSRCISTTDTNGDGMMNDTDPLCDQERRYRRSCENYNNANCSDSNHQSRRRCYSAETKVVTEVVSRSCSWVESIPVIGGLLGEWVCDNATDFVETVEEVEVCLYDTNISGTSGFNVTSALPFYTPIIDAQFGVDQAKAFLAGKTPIVFCFTVPDSFGKASSNGGFVQFDANEKGDGGHCVLMTGFVDNKELPSGVPPGDGGGYFIVKNSWGCDFGDQGYAYLPYSWVKKWGTEMIAVTSVN